MYNILLIGAEGGEDSSKMLTYFLRAWADSRMGFSVLREYGAGETPQALQRRGDSTARPRKAKPPGEEINRPIEKLIYQYYYGLTR
ncbi:hypothetical protein [Neobacillus mesonae]|uniref:hypothetical protein n=1 Tax=Neobacillus mesonae TaxID=1193713 RepID=UPI00257333A0|nr:hypothetical protein [Neobacillus mesonae]MED4203387.1 hypothetical protein [Neobacillus mesonae]